MSTSLPCRNPGFPAALRTSRVRVGYVLGSVLFVSGILAAGCGIQISAPTGTRGSEQFKVTNFDAGSSNITNTWVALRPGTRLIYDGIIIDRGVDVPRRSEITTTSLTKVIDGIRSLVIYSVDYTNGQLVEAALTFLAQDKTGNVWRMGEYPEEYISGQLRDAPTWIHGIENSVAGIWMLATPTIGADYSQGWGPAVAFTDRGIVDQIGVRACLQENVCYDNVLVIAEYAPGEPFLQLKYFSRGIGYIHEGFRGEGDRNRERLDLVQVEQLSAVALQSICEQAHALEASAMDISPDIYGRTLPIDPPSCP